ncbi:ATP-binding cassette, subfamily C [Duganella sp. CF458]|uniref:ABC transporter ATP-binding protein n=1 Tax=Duganella sp. CF458 TaxID=1884368 RepID=UPI0008F441FE|nr:ABC transporter ATP-binding protein [Duganella sp. CF458]SFG37483.1 ATP-binding cassette, subfamily C [Duganella sp. CF458]
MTERLSWPGLLRQLVRARRHLALANGAAFLVGLVSLPMPALIPKLVDWLLLRPGTQPAWLAPAGGWAALLLPACLLALLSMRLAVLVLNRFQADAFMGLSKDLVFQLRTGFMRHLEHVRLHALERAGGAMIAARGISDIDLIGNFLGATLSRALVAALSLLCIAAALLWLNAWLAVAIFLIYPGFIVFSVRASRQFTELKMREMQASEELTQALSNAAEHARTLRVTSRSQAYFRAMEALAASARDTSRQFASASTAAMQKSIVIFNVCVDLFQVAAVGMACYFGLSVPEMLTMFAYLWLMLNPMLDLMQLPGGFFSVGAAMARLNEVFALEREPDPGRANGAGAPSGAGWLCVSGLAFSYPGGAPLLAGLSFTVPAGALVGIRGPSGSGKSTLLDLLLGFLCPHRGEIRLNGLPLSHFQLADLRRYIALVPQKPGLLAGTLRDNVRLASAADDAAILRMLRHCQLESWLASLPQGLDTVVGPGGQALSGGQVQRLAIAGALLSPASILIFDEATSALDLETEERLVDAIMPLLRERTTIVVSHRLSILAATDATYELNGGRLQGSPTLMQPQLLTQDTDV